MNSYKAALRRQRELLDQMLVDEDPIRDEDVRGFLKNPRLILPKSCVEARRTAVDRVYLDYPAWNEPGALLITDEILRGPDGPQHVIRHPGREDFLCEHDLRYEVLGFVDSLPVYSLRSMGTCDPEHLKECEDRNREVAGYYHGYDRVAFDDFEKLRQNSKSRFSSQVIERPIARQKGEDYKGHVYSLTGSTDPHSYAAIAVPARHGQIAYAIKSSKHGAWYRQEPFLHVTPPFKNSHDREWRYWGTTGTHLCLMEFSFP